MRPPRRRQSGLSLLEVMLATALFALASGISLEISSNAAENTLQANNQRILRMLAERKLGEILTFEEHALDEYFEGDFGDEYSEYEDIYDDWEWKLDVIDRELFPPAAEDHGEPLLPDPDQSSEDDEEILEETTTKSRENNQTLTEIRLVVSAPGEEGERDFIEVVMLLAPGDLAPAAPGPGANPGGPR